jgi:hypothetical protein
MNGDVPSRRQIEAQWRARLAEAERRYSRAKRECENAAAVYSRHEIPFPDGHLGLNKALQREHLALQDYRHALTILNQLTVHGKLPPEEAQG